MADVKQELPGAFYKAFGFCEFRRARLDDMLALLPQLKPEQLDALLASVDGTVYQHLARARDAAIKRAVHYEKLWQENHEHKDRAFTERNVARKRVEVLEEELAAAIKRAEEGCAEWQRQYERLLQRAEEHRKSAIDAVKLRAENEKLCAELATIAERQREACLQRLRRWGESDAGLPQSVDDVIAETPLVTDAPSKPDGVGIDIESAHTPSVLQPAPKLDTACWCGDALSAGIPCPPGKCPNAPHSKPEDPLRDLACRQSDGDALAAAQKPEEPCEGSADCDGCMKVWRHHHRGERGTVCARHNYGPSGEPTLREPAVSKPEELCAKCGGRESRAIHDPYSVAVQHFGKPHHAFEPAPPKSLCPNCSSCDGFLVPLPDCPEHGVNRPGQALDEWDDEKCDWVLGREDSYPIADELARAVRARNARIRELEAENEDLKRRASFWCEDSKTANTARVRLESELAALRAKESPDVRAAQARAIRFLAKEAGNGGVWSYEDLQWWGTKVERGEVTIREET